MSISAVIVDDERINIKLLAGLIKNYCPDVEIVDTATNVNDGIKAVVRHKPQILFLDIEIHDKTGFDILKVIDEPSLQVVLITAYEKYAVQAFKYSVVDYLLKPIRIEDLVVAVKRCKARIQELKDNAANNNLLNEETDVLGIYEKDNITLLRFHEIIYLGAKGSYTEIGTNNNKKYVSSRSLKENEETLPANLFIRVHNSFVVNVHHIMKCIRNKNGLLVMRDGSNIPISASRKKEVYEKLHF